MLLFAFLLLTSALASQRHGAQAESNLSVKLQFSSAKEQNGAPDSAGPVSNLQSLDKLIKMMSIENLRVYKHPEPSTIEFQIGMWLFNLTAIFNTVDYKMLLTRLQELAVMASIIPLKQGLE
ncbi:unnamed protein product [Caretta caretta]